MKHSDLANDKYIRISNNSRDSVKISSKSLPADRRLTKVFLLSIITAGIYGLVTVYEMSRETNESCREDKLHTSNAWGAFVLSIITFGIYGLVWGNKWTDREYSYLVRSYPDGGILKGGVYVALVAIMTIIILSFMVYFIFYNNAEFKCPTMFLIFFALLATGSYMILLAKQLKQHNTVNRIHNLKNIS